MQNFLFSKYLKVFRYFFSLFTYRNCGKMMKIMMMLMMLLQLLTVVLAAHLLSSVRRTNPPASKYY